MIRKCITAAILFLSCSLSLKAATYTVDITGDTDDLGTSTPGTNTLRKCIRLANANPGLDSIRFNIGIAPYVINRTINVSIIDPVVIDGYTEAGAVAGAPLITVTFVGNNGFHLAAGSDGSTISGIIIYGTNRGIYVENSDSCTISGNFIGTNATATGSAPTVIQWSGIEVNSSDHITIGGAGGLIDRNIISDCNEDGIRINNASVGASINNNYIGTDITGNVALGNNQNGIDISNNSLNATITNNIICSNGQPGIFIFQNADYPTITGNRIGLGADGTTQLGNTGQGINIENTLKPIIGGTSISERNYVSNNTNIGIRLFNADSVIIKGNFIGLNENGDADHGNVEHGIWMNQSDYPTIGGGEAGARNYISGNNQFGLFIETSLAPTIIDNYFGTDTTGNVGIGNGQSGIRLVNNCHNPIIADNISCASTNGQGIQISNCDNPLITGNRVGLALDGVTQLGNQNIGINLENCYKPIIGGATLAERNYVSNNNQIGIRIQNGDSVIIKGNYVGLNEAGDTDYGNNNMGVWMLDSDYPTIGGGEAGARNYISGNSQTGLHIERSLSPVVVDNYIGTDVTGLNPIGNQGFGVRIVNSCDDPLVTDNIISANTQHGLGITQSPRPIVKSNIIGLGLDEITAMGNGQRGIEIIESDSAQVGGTLVSERNYIADNGQLGIHMNNSANSRIEGNYIGTDATGTAAKGNGNQGIEVVLCDSIVIGSPNGGRNIIVDNGDNGITVSNCLYATVQSNFVGVGADGGFNDALPQLGNAQHGIILAGDSHYSLIGGSNPEERNIVSNNGSAGAADGIRLGGPARGVQVLGNYCGVDSTGTKERGNTWAGISVNGNDSTYLGGSGQYEGNITSGNHHEGIYLAFATNTFIRNNKIGTDTSGTQPLGNYWYGIRFGSNGASTNNIVGGASEYANIIAFTKDSTNPDPGEVVSENGPGIYVHEASQFNTFSHNSIFCNAGLGIDLMTTANESVASPTIDSSSANVAYGTGDPNFIIDFYVNSTAGTDCGCEGETYLGSTVVALDGTWSFAHNLSFLPGDSRSITATQTTTTLPVGSTSEFACLSLYPCDIVINNHSGDSIACEGDSVRFEVSAVGTSLEIQWQLLNSGTFVNIPGEIDSILDLGLAVTSMDSTYYRAIAYNSAGCADTTDTMALYVTPATLFTDHPSDTTLCTGQTLNLSATATGQNISYQWYKDGVIIASATSDTYNVPVVTVVDSGSYYVEATGDCGILNSDTINVLVSVVPDETLAVSDADICAGNDAVITVSASQSGVQYEAFFGGSMVSSVYDGNGGNLDITVPSATIPEGISQVAIHAYGCSDTTLLDTATVTVLGAADTIHGPVNVCAGSVTGLVYSIDSVPGAATYNWNIINGTITASSTDSDSITVDLGSSPTTIEVTPETTSGFTCSTTQIQVTQLPDYTGLDTLVSNEDTVCTANTITFDINNASAESYTWSLPAGASIVSINSDSTSATISFANSGDHTVSVQPFHSCSPGISSLTTDVTILEQPVANAGTDITLSQIETVTLDGSGSSTGANYQYQWTTTGSSTIDQPDSLVTTAIPQGSTIYLLTVSTTNDAFCEATDVMNVIIPLEIPHVPNIFSPNGDGAHDYLVINNIEYATNAVLYVYNQWGELIYESEPGYTIPWDGTRNGVDVPVSAYYYILELNEDGYEALTGHITIVR